LRNDGMLDRTTIVFLGDHGEELWDHGGFYHGHTLYQEQLHVPLIVAGPEIAAQVVDTPVSLVDVVPALWEVYARRDVLGELEVPEHLAGRGGALADTLLEGAQLEAEPVFAYGTVPGDFVEHEYAVIDGGWKLIEHRDGVTCELYHLETDPKEQRDLCAEEPEKAAKLRALLDAWKAETPLRVEASENDEALERLEALGYL